MNRTALGLILIGVTVFLLPGCGKTPPPVNSSRVKSATPKADSLKPALDLLRQGTEVGNYRDALNLINSHLTNDGGKQITPLAPEERERLRKLYRLDDEEMAEVDASLFRPLDASHLQACCLFRDAARLLEVADVTPLEQARLCFDWVMRRVQLHEQADEGLPSTFVLRRGYGGGLDRALAFLALVRQFQIVGNSKSIEGCLLAPPGPPEASGPLLAGVLVSLDQKPTLFLFDPRLGLPVAGPGGKGIATLGDVRADPSLLKASAIAADMAAKLEVYQAGPLEALSARMRYLQGLLEFQDKVILFQDALGVGRDLAKAAGRDALVWAPLDKSASPTRALRQFLAPGDGGIDRRGRQQRFLIQQVPWHVISRQFQEMGLFQTKDIPEQAWKTLFHNTEALFTKFALEPREFFLQGKFKDTLKRVDRMRSVLEIEEAAKPLEEDAFKKRLNAWRARVSEAYTALLLRMEPGAQAKVDALWSEDQYLLNVLHPDDDFPLQKFEKKFLSLLLFKACREPLGQQVNYLVASCLHEEAVQLQANQDVRAGAGKDVTVVKDNADYAWKNARGAWHRFLERYLVSAKSLPERLAEIGQRWNKGELDTALNLWEQLHLDIHIAIEARLRLAEAQQRLLGSSAALQDLMADVDALEKSDLSKTLNQSIDKARANPLLAQRLELLARDWSPQGNMHWLREAARRRLDKGK